MIKSYYNKKACIPTDVIPWILGIGGKPDKEISFFINYGSIINNDYFINNIKISTNEDILKLHSVIENEIYKDNNINECLSDQINETTYNILSCYSKMYFININNVRIITNPTGITKNKKSIVIVNYQLDKYDENEIEIILLVSMAIWNTDNGIYIIKKLDKKIKLVFCEIKWNKYLEEITKWIKLNDI